MRFIWPHKLPGMFWDAFVKDSLRIYRVLPRRLKLAFWMVFALQIVSAVTEMLTLLVISLFAMSVTSPEAAMSHFLVRPFLELVPAVAEFCSSPRRMVAFTSSFMILFVVVKSALAMATNYQSAVFSEKVALHVGRESIRRYLNKGYYWHISSKSAEVVHKIISRGSLAQLTVQLLTFYSNIICCLFLFTSLFIAQPGLTLVVVVCFGSASLVLYAGLRQSVDKAGQLASSTAIEDNMVMTAMTKGIREVVTYRQQETAMAKMLSAVARGLPARAYLAFCYTMPAAIMETVGFTTIGGMVIYLLSRKIPMEEIVASASILMLTAWRILPAVTRSLALSVGIRGVKPRAQICLDLLETFAKEKVEAAVAPDPTFKFSGSLELKKASFHYPDTDKDALIDVTLSIRKGQSAGLIGPSGAGKSTLALLVSGLVSPTEGLFEVDGRPLTPETQASYLLKLGYVPQNPLLMEGSLADNVAFSQWGRKYDRGEVVRACRLAAMDFAIEDPEALDKPVGGGGLSGGESQRVAIARALFARPEVVIFDEATSALDMANEGAIRKTIGRVRGEITSVIIAHRLTTVQDCDVIFWIEDGGLRMSGPPAEVIPAYERSLERAAEQRDGRAGDGGGD
ncbi:MAG: ABC transporter ATP-binding protein/permease [Deltaproteobacteria bacterium]|nr:ABC transporter ATP-binding protein/permease [Deltaproteobacteria bacterium]